MTPKTIAKHIVEELEESIANAISEAIKEHESEALAAFQRYKEEKWLDVPASTLNELLHLIQTKEYQRGYDAGHEAGIDSICDAHDTNHAYDGN